MNESVDMNPAQFNRHERASEARFIKEQLRKNETPESEQQPERLTVDFAHTTDAVNFLLAELDCPAALRGFLDSIIGVAGFRAARNEWFPVSDKQLAARADRTTKWVQDQRKELIKWQYQHDISLVDIEDNLYEDGMKTPHKYLVHIARIAAETTLNARDSLKWKTRKYDEAMREEARTMLDSLPQVPIHKKHKKYLRNDPEKTMEQDLSFALTKIKGAIQTNELTGNNVELTAKMLETVKAIRNALNGLEHGRRSNVAEL